MGWFGFRKEQIHKGRFDFLEWMLLVLKQMSGFISHAISPPSLSLSNQSMLYVFNIKFCVKNFLL